MASVNVRRSSWVTKARVASGARSPASADSSAASCSSWPPPVVDAPSSSTPAHAAARPTWEEPASVGWWRGHPCKRECRGHQRAHDVSGTGDGWHHKRAASSTHLVPPHDDSTPTRAAVSALQRHASVRGGPHARHAVPASLAVTGGTGRGRLGRCIVHTQHQDLHHARLRPLATGDGAGPNAWMRACGGVLACVGGEPQPQPTSPA